MNNKMQFVSTQAEMQADDFVLANMLGKEAEVKGKVLPRAEGPYPIIGVNSGKRMNPGISPGSAYLCILGMCI